MLQAVHISSALVPTSTDINTLMGDFSWGKLLWLMGAGLLVWAFKKDWIGIVTFGPYDRGYREFFGRPGRMLGQGPHPHIIGIGNLRRASVATSIVTLGGRVTVGGRIYAYIFVVGINIVDLREHVHSAIYKTFDENKKDSYNAQRIDYVKNAIEKEVREIIEGGLECPSPEAQIAKVTQESLSGRCADHLLLVCGTEINRVMLTEFTPVDSQIIKDGMLELQPNGEGSTTVVPFPSSQTQVG